MNREEIIRMAREAGFELTMWQLSLGYETCGTHDELERFAALVAAAEREACARLCEQPIDEIQITDDCSEYIYRDNQQCVDDIRARGQE